MRLIPTAMLVVVVALTGAGAIYISYRSDEAARMERRVARIVDNTEKLGRIRHELDRLADRIERIEAKLGLESAISEGE